jgi:hypothetical protein
VPHSSRSSYIGGSRPRTRTWLFASRRVPRQLDPAQFAPPGLRIRGQGKPGAQHFFTVAGRPFYLYVVLAGPRTARRRQLAAIDHVLKSLLSTTRCEKL